MASNGYDGPLRLSGKIVQITNSPIYLKVSFIKKADNSQYEKYWLEQHMDKEAIQKTLAGTFKEGDEITVTIDTHHSFGGGIQLLKDFNPKAQGNGFSGFKSSYNPEADAKRQRLIVRQSCLDRATQLYIAKFGDELKKISGSHVLNITAIADEFVDWVMKE